MKWEFVGATNGSWLHDVEKLHLGQKQVLLWEVSGFESKLEDIIFIERNTFK